MKIKAAVVSEINELIIETVELDAPQAGEVLVKMKAAGICHSDLHTYRGELTTPPPVVLGHEGAGIVEAVGPGVLSLKVGDPVLINWLPSCETCPNCLNGHFNLCQTFDKTAFVGTLPDGTSRLKTLDGVQLKHYLGAATMAEYIVVSEANAIAIPPEIPFDVAAIIGCAVATGVGAVINTAQVLTGSSVVVIGCGGIGLSIIQGCQLAGCYPLVAIDVVGSKLEFAQRIGASHTVNAAEEKVSRVIRQLIPNRPDYAFDAVGSAKTIPQALRLARAGGTAVIVGLHSANDQVPISPGSLVFENKRLLGSFVGSAHPKLDLPKLVDLYQVGRLKLDQLITNRYTLDELSAAFVAMEAGQIAARGVIMFGD